MKPRKLRTNLRRLFIVIALVWSRPDMYSLIIGASLVVIGQLIHFISTGYLVKNDQLTTAGPYRFTRNPFYIGNLFYDGGLCVMATNPYIAAIYLPIFYLIVIPGRIRKEEKFLAEKFGQDYLNYCRSVPRFFPRLLPASSGNSSKFSWSQIVKYRESWRVMRAFGLIIIFYLQFSINYDIFNQTTQWHHLLSTSLNIIVLSLLVLILVIPPIIEYGFRRRDS